MTTKLTEMIKIADMHAKRINQAMNKLIGIFPMSTSKIENISEENFLLIELLINRFAKLQDYLGTKIIDVFLEDQGEIFIDNMTMIDKLHKLEKLEMVDDAELWKQMREVRNNLVHEYPDNMGKTADNLNKLFMLAPKLLAILENIKKRLKI